VTTDAAPRRIRRGQGWVVVIDSAAEVPEDARDCVVVCGSHGGVTAVQFAVVHGVRGIILNDAGVGKEDAGIAGLATAQQWGIAAAAVSCESARIGDGEDTYRAGVVSHLNEVAHSVGVSVGMGAAEAAQLLTETVAPAATAPTVVTPLRRLLVIDTPPTVLVLDSASQIDPAATDRIVVCGSHGGIVSGRAIRHPVAGAVFNDAGVGKAQAGVERLWALQALDIPSFTVSHNSARIGDGLDTYENGIVSRVNRPAMAARIAEGSTAPEAVRLLLERRPPRQR
jgi:hypothetical protein